MKPNGRRAWRRWCKRARLRMNSHHRALYRSAIMRKKQPERTPMPLKDVKPLTARSLVGMSQSSRKRRRWEWVQAAGQYDAPGAAKAIGAKLRIGERLRSCLGCPQCTDNPLRIVRALSRRMKIRVEVRRCNSSIIPSKFDYLAMLHRPGPNWNPVCGFGPMSHDAVRALCDVILQEGAEEFPIVSCDGSGVLSARKQK